MAVGYPIGAAVGARQAATIQERKPPFGSILVVSVVSAAFGGLVWYQIGESFEDSWLAGAATGFSVHLALTSLWAQREGRRASR